MGTMEQIHMQPEPCQPGASLAPGHQPQSQPHPSSMAVVVSVLLPSTREVMIWEMMDCKYPANGSLQPGQGPGTLTGNVSIGLGRDGWT